MFRRKCLVPAVPLLVVLLCAGVIPARGLVIQVTFDSTITNDAHAAIIENTLNSVVSFYEASFADPITVTVEFKEMTSGLGRSLWYYYTIPYTEFYDALAADATTANDALALAFLGSDSTNPVTGDLNIDVKTANLRAIGIFGLDPPTGMPDGVIMLDTTIMNLSRPLVLQSRYDLFSVAAHELDEILGLGSALDFTTTDPLPEDLFRYDSSGNRNFTTSGDDAYFSLDGTTLLARFNQISGADHGDWWSSGTHVPKVQDAIASAGATPDPTVELAALDVIGYDLVQPTLSLAPAGPGQVTISWPAIWSLYALQQNTNLTTTNWVNVTNSVVVTNGLDEVIVPAAAGAAFYRLMIP